MLIVPTLIHVWPLTLFILALFGGLAALALKVRVRALDVELAPAPVFYAAIAVWFPLICILLIFIDRPYIDALKGMESMLFMVSAFFGIPFCFPILAVAVYALVCNVTQGRVHPGVAALLAGGALGLGLAASNIHDIVWCGAITDAFAHTHAAGADLDAFAWLGMSLGLSRETMYDYATLGSSAFVMVFGELLLAVACFLRLDNMRKRD